MQVKKTIQPISGLPDTIPDHARIWIYQCNRILEDTLDLERALGEFCISWTAHDKALKAWYALPEKAFVLLAVDESQAGASGCSIDTSVRFMEELGRKMNLDFFDRHLIGWKQSNGVFNISRFPDFKKLWQGGVIRPETLVCNPLVLTAGEFRSSWLVPFKDSWQAKLL